MTQPSSDQSRRDFGDQFQERMEAFGREAQAAGERFGREAQAAGDRLSRDPGLVAAGTWFTRAIGLILVGLGLWFFGVASLGLDLPAVEWDLVWPALLIVVGGLVLLGTARRAR